MAAHRHLHSLHPGVLAVLKTQADYMASVMWESYCKTTEPARKRHYALRYEFWAGLRDKKESNDSPKEGVREKATDG